MYSDSTERSFAGALVFFLVMALSAYVLLVTALVFWLAELLGLEMPLSSYTSRHTWATTARNHNVPLSIISAGMGHASEKTTQIYLASLESSVVDQANRSIIASLYV